MESTLVIKVKYGDTLRRFNAIVNGNEQLNLDMDGLRAKIISLFNFSHEAELTLTYIDEDGDVVTLVDDDDLCDVMRQRLKFLRIDAHLTGEKKFGNSSTRSSGTSTPMRIPRVQLPLTSINTGVPKMLKSVPEPVREALSNLSIEFASKAASSSPVFAELVECFSKIGQSYLNPVSTESGPSEKHVAPSAPIEPNTARDGWLLEVLPKSTSVDSASKSCPENVTGRGKTPITDILAPVDLNLDPPCDSNLSGSTAVDFGTAASNDHAGGDRKAAKDSDGILRGKFVSFDAPTRSADPLRRSDVHGSPTSGFRAKSSNECPFSGIPVTNDSVMPSYRYPRISPLKFHKGIRCGGCGVHPITGPRFKSKVKEDYDLCSICFSEMGNETDYIRMDRPVLFRQPRSRKGFYVPAPNTTVGGRVIPPPHARPCRTKLDSCFILDVNILDGTILAPSTTFTKIWRMQNNGTSMWPRGAQLVWIGGDRFTDAVSVELEIPADGVPVDGVLDVAVDFTAPELPGRYISYWRMASLSAGLFGQRIWVLIQVDSALEDYVCDSFQGLNLNMPPENSSPKGLGSIDINVQPNMDGRSLDRSSSSSKRDTEPSKPMADGQPKKEELNFPTNDSLLVGRDASPLVPLQAPPSSSVSYPIIDISDTAPIETTVPVPLRTPSSPVSYPIIDLSDTAPIEITVPVPLQTLSSPVSYPIIDLSDTVPIESIPAKYSLTDIPSSSGEVDENDVIEHILLKELEEMGFKQVDLNKEILRMNEYDLEQSVDALCDVAEWDPILVELQEMGFCDQEINKKLLKKNNGSIKRVVMDLLAGEKA